MRTQVYYVAISVQKSAGMMPYQVLFVPDSKTSWNMYVVYCGAKYTRLHSHKSNTPIEWGSNDSDTSP